jgi:hypothetical protein
MRSDIPAGDAVGEFLQHSDAEALYRGSLDEAADALRSAGMTPLSVHPDKAYALRDGVVVEVPYERSSDGVRFGEVTESDFRTVGKHAAAMSAGREITEVAASLLAGDEGWRNRLRGVVRYASEAVAAGGVLFPRHAVKMIEDAETDERSAWLRWYEENEEDVRSDLMGVLGEIEADTPKTVARSGQDPGRTADWCEEMAESFATNDSWLAESLRDDLTSIATGLRALTEADDSALLSRNHDAMVNRLRVAAVLAAYLRENP